MTNDYFKDHKINSYKKNIIVIFIILGISGITVR